MTVQRIPLFPLPLVLFPGADLPLHVFEPRYKEMIRECISSSSEFGVVLARDEGIAKVGCTAELIEVTREYPDGRMDIHVEGRTTFEVVELFQEKAYYEAAIQPLAEETDPKAAVLPPTLLDSYARCHELLFGGPPDEIDRSEHDSVAYYIADDLPFDLNDKQIILTLRDETERLAQLLILIEQLVPRAEARQRMRQKAGGNGHAQP